jgi:hypothetical protein
MAFIVEQYASDRAIQIGREQLFRKFSFGTNWQRIRIGIRAAMTAPATASIGGFFNGPILALCTGPIGPFSPATVDCIFNNFWGGQGMTLAGSAPNQYYDLGSTGWTHVSYQKVGGTQSNSTGFGFGRTCISASPSALRSFFAFDVTKGTIGATSYTANWYYQVNTQATVDFTRNAFLAAMTTEGTPANTTNTSQAAYCGLRTVKDWDTMMIASWRSVPTITIFDMAVVRYS